MYNNNLAKQEYQDVTLSWGGSVRIPLQESERVGDPACLINHIGTNSKSSSLFENDFYYQMDRKVKETFEQSFERENGYPLNFVTSEDIRPDYQKWLRRYESYSYKKQGDVVSLDVKYYLESENVTDFWQKFKQKKYVGSKRGEVSKTMSSKSAWRLKQLLLRSDLKKYTNKQKMFVTLTFPNPVENIEKAKKLLKKFNQQFKRKYNVGCVWKQEFQGNTAVHYHLFQVIPNSEIEIGNYWIKQADGSLVPWERGEQGKQGHQVKHETAVKGYRWEVQKYWEKLVKKEFGEEGSKIFNASVQVDYVKNSDAIAWYFAEYTTKEKDLQNQVPEGIENHGRWWGQTNYEQFMAEIDENELTYEEYEQIQKDLAIAMGQEYDEEKRKHYVLAGEKTNELIKKITELPKKKTEKVTNGYLTARLKRAIEIRSLYDSCIEKVEEYRDLVETYRRAGRRKLWERTGIEKKEVLGIENVVELDDLQKTAIERFQTGKKYSLLSACIGLMDETYEY